MSPSSVPISFDWFWVKGDGDTEVFGNSLENVPSHPEVVAHGDSLTRSNLELPLSWHHLCIGSTNLNSGIHAAFDMSSLYISSINFSSTNSTIVWSLGSRKSILWPSKGMLVIIKQGVLLLDPKPRFVLLGLLHDLKTLFSVVSNHGLIFVIISFTKHKDVITEGKGTWIHLDRLQIHIRIGAISLVTRTAIVVKV